MLNSRVLGKIQFASSVSRVVNILMLKTLCVVDIMRVKK